MTLSCYHDKVTYHIILMTSWYYDNFISVIISFVDPNQFFSDPDPSFLGVSDPDPTWLTKCFWSDAKYSLTHNANDFKGLFIAF
jgi:hypothetical protein